MQQSPMPPAKVKKSRRFLLIGIMVLVIIVGIALVSNHSNSSNLPTVNRVQTTATTQNQAATDAPTQALTAPPQWKTVQTFTGTGTKKTAIFAVPGDWKIIWSCTGVAAGDGTFIDGTLAAMVYNSDNTLADTGFNATCKGSTTPTVDSTEEHQAGNVYLNVIATGAWTIHVQELR